MDSVLKAPKGDQSWLGSKRRQNLFVFIDLLQFLPLSKTKGPIVYYVPGGGEGVQKSVVYENRTPLK